MSRVLSSVLLALGGGTIAAGAYAASRAGATRSSTEGAVRAGGRIAVRLTGYWPFTARADERRMEGGKNDRRGRPLHTLEQHLADPAAHPYVSVSGDDAVWPYGQRIAIDEWPGAVFRVVDTGRNFRGSTKVYRAVGHEPLDICVDSQRTKVTPLSMATIFPGDNFEGGRAVATSGIRDQRVVLGFAGEDSPRPRARDAEVLARAVESSRPSGTVEEKQAVAWACRNRAAALGVPVADVLAPAGECGPRGSGGRDFASTSRAAGDESRKVALAVLSLPASADPTGGAVDFWCLTGYWPFTARADERRAALRTGDGRRASALSAYAAYDADEEGVRKALRACGLAACGVVGELELLRAEGDAT